jgi:predicted DNA-binding transcriptional regulator AlpA
VSLKLAITSFDRLPDTAVVDISTAAAITGRSRNSIYRHFQAGELTPIKIGFSTRVRVSDIRRLLGVKSK